MAAPLQAKEVLRRILVRQKYHIVGAHSAVKKCKWLHESLLGGRVCYKQKFFGIESHRCLQMSPAVFQCTQRCLWCWRVMPEDLGYVDNFTTLSKLDEPRQILDGCLAEQERILSGYNDLVKRGIVSAKRLEESRRPNNFAISLAGEPTIYSLLGDLIAELKRRGFTVFLVTNGTLPKALRCMGEEPTQLYVTVGAPTRDIYEAVARPRIADGFERLKETLSLLGTFSCPTVFRITSASGLNMVKPEAYAELALSSSPTYIEIKGAMSVGYGMNTGRMKRENMPSMGEIRCFAQSISHLAGYEAVGEDPDSRVVLLSKNGKTARLG